jgi:hypothetical protein
MICWRIVVIWVDSGSLVRFLTFLGMDGEGFQEMNRLWMFLFSAFAEASE